jgi:hypothetical protein
MIRSSSYNAIRALSALGFGLLQNACSAPTRESVIVTSTRIVTLPSSIAALSQAESAPGLPAQISFGSAQGRSALYLKFPTDLAAHGVPLKAFIALSPRADAPVDATPATVEAWRVSAAWQAEQLVVWSDKPPLAPPYARAQLESSLPGEQRIDVSELARFAAQNPDLDFGIALLGRTGSGHGATFATGINGGVAPRLEIYVR